MPLYKATDEASSKPKWLTSSEKTNCLGADATETGASTTIMHQGWTVPAGGNGNTGAQRETLVCLKMTTDVGAGDDTGLGIPSSYVTWNGLTSFGNEAGKNDMTMGAYGGGNYHVTGGEWENYHNANSGGVWDNYDAGISSGTEFTLRVNDATDINCTIQAVMPSGSAAAAFVFNTSNASAMTAWIATVGASVHKFSLYETYQG
jgi:hypothetical protein